MCNVLHFLWEMENEHFAFYGFSFYYLEWKNIFYGEMCSLLLWKTTENGSLPLGLISAKMVENTFTAQN